MKGKALLYSFHAALALITICLWTSAAYARTQNAANMKKKILFMVTSHNIKENTGEPTGLKQEQSDESVSLLTRYEVKKGHLKIFRKELHKYVRRVVRKDGNIMAEGYYEQESPSVMWLIERWSSKAALDKNRKRVKYKVVKLLSKKKLTQPATEFYVRDLEPLSKQEWQREASKEEKSITIMLFVYSKVGTEDNFKEVYHTAMPQFRSEPGVVNYQLSEFVDDSTQFVTYEKFRNEEAFQYHLKFPPIQPVIDYLNTSIKQQPFQRGLHRLVMFAPVKRK